MNSKLRKLGSCRLFSDWLHSESRTDIKTSVQKHSEVQIKKRTPNKNFQTRKLTETVSFRFQLGKTKLCCLFRKQAQVEALRTGNRQQEAHQAVALWIVRKNLPNEARTSMPKKQEHSICSTLLRLLPLSLKY